MSLSIVASLLLLSANLYSQENLTTLPATQTPNAVSFSAGTYTFPEIAAKLSQGKVIVTCAKSIRNHAAVVSLKARTLPNAMKILAKGLDLQFRQNDNSGKSFTMEWDPKVIAREKPWLEHLAEELLRQYRKDKLVNPPPAGLTQSQLANKYIAATERLRQLETTDPMQTDPATRTAQEKQSHWASLISPVNWYRYYLENLNKQEILDAIISDQPFRKFPFGIEMDRKALHKIADFDRAQAEIDISESKRKDPKILDYWRAIVLEKWDETANTVSIGCRRIKFNPAIFALYNQIVTQQLTEWQIPWQAPSEGKELAMQLDLLGRSCKRFREDLRKLGKSMTARIPAKEPIDITGPFPTENLSQILERWAIQYHHEVVMEILPDWDFVGTNTPDPALGEHERPLKSFSLKRALDTGLFHPFAVDGVTCFQHEGASLMRRRGLPFAAIFAMEKTRRKREVSGQTRSLHTFAELDAFQRMISDSDCARLSEVWNFRGTDLNSVAMQRALHILFSGLTTQERNDLLSSTNFDSPVNRTVSSFGAKTTRRLARYIAELTMTGMPGYKNVDVLKVGLIDRVGSMDIELKRIHFTDRVELEVNLLILPGPNEWQKPIVSFLINVELPPMAK